MKYYKNTATNEVYAYDNVEDFDAYAPAGLVEMTAPEIAAHLTPQPSHTTPQKVTMRQARLALHSAGLLPQVEVAINALPEPPRTAARIEWDFSSEVHRDKEFVALMGTALGLSSAELDELFVQAALL